MALIQVSELPFFSQNIAMVTLKIIESSGETELLWCFRDYAQMRTAVLAFLATTLGHFGGKGEIKGAFGVSIFPIHREPVGATFEFPNHLYTSYYFVLHEGCTHR